MKSKEQFEAEALAKAEILNVKSPKLTELDSIVYKKYRNPEYESHLNVPFSHSLYAQFDAKMNQVGSNNHTASKPYTYAEVAKYYNMKEVNEQLKKKASGWWARKLWNENTVEIQGEDYWFTLNPIFDLQLGKASQTENSYTYVNTRALNFRGGLGKQLNFTTTVFESQGRFADYYNPKNMRFGVLRVVNDDIIHTTSGFDMHPHENVEIITYVINGELTHKDSLGNIETLTRGDIQYLSAGDGIYHSEYNKNKSLDLRLLQIWIIPPKVGLPRLYGSNKFEEIQRKNKFLNIVSGQNGTADIKIHQDINIYVSQLDSDKNLDFHIEENRQVYFVQIEGKSDINGLVLNNGDAVEIINEKQINIKALENSHFLFIEMAKV